MSKVLVVKPSGPERDAIKESLGREGYEVLLSVTAEDAVQLALKTHPALVLMDPSLPVMERWHAVKRLMTDDGTKKIPILTLADDAHTDSGSTRLVKKVAKTVKPASGTPTPAPRQPLSDKEPPKRAAVPARKVVVEKNEGRILVVDDNDMNRDMLSRRLKRRGYTVATSEGGVQALGYIAENPIDLVLLDVMMPEMSGTEVLTKLRTEFSRTELPIIMATARTQSEDIVEALRLGANDYVTKPFDFEVVHARVKTQLALRHAHLRLAQSEQRFRALLENTGDLVTLHARDGTFSYVSPACLALLGYQPSELVGTSIFDLIHRVDRKVLQARQKNQPMPPAYTYISRFRRKDGQFIWVETSNRLIRDVEGEIESVQTACRDVTEHMSRIAGVDEPPLPMGGDVMEHPGWRSGG